MEKLIKQKAIDYILIPKDKINSELNFFEATVTLFRCNIKKRFY